MRIELLSGRTILLILASLVLGIFASNTLVNLQAVGVRSENLRRDASIAAWTLENAVETAASLTAALSRLDARSDDCGATLADVRAAGDGAYAVLGLADADGRLLCADPSGSVGELLSDPFPPAGLPVDGEVVYGDYLLSPATGDALLIVARPTASGEAGTLALVGLDLGWLSDQLRADWHNEFGRLVVTDSAGIVIASSVDAVPVGASLDASERGRSLAADVERGAGTSHLRPVVLGDRTFEVIAVAPEQGLMAIFQRFLPALALINLLGGLAASILAFQRLRRGVRAPVRRMLMALPPEEMARAEPEDGLESDLDQLALAFGGMTARLDLEKTRLDQACVLAGLGTWTILPDGESVLASSHIRAILGLPEEDEVLQLDAVRERIVPADRLHFDAAIDRALTEEQTTDVEFRILDASGEVRQFRVRTVPSERAPEDADDTGIGVSGIVQDITDLRNKETALARSRTLGHLAGEAAQIGGWRYELDSATLIGTRETANLIRRQKHERPRKLEEVIAQFIDDEARTRIERGFWTCAGAGVRFDETAEFLRLDGTKAWLRVIGEAQRDASGKIVSVYGALQDMGEIIGARRATEQVSELFQTVIDSMGDGFAIHDADGTIQYMNSKAHRILGAADRCLVGQNMWRDVPAIIGSQFAKTVAEAMESGKTRQCEGELGAADSWIVVSVHPTHAGVAIYFKDMTENRAAREHMRLLDAAFEKVSDVVLITDAKSLDPPGPMVVYVNEAFVTMTGYSREEILGDSPRILQGPETDKNKLANIRKAMQETQPILTELKNYRKDGSTFTVELNINPVFDGEGTCTHYVSVQRDTTERHAADEHLRAREEQFRLASLASQDIIWDWDLRTGVIWNSERLEDKFGSTGSRRSDEPRERQIENVLEWVHPEDRLSVTESLDSALAGDKDIWRCEYRVTGPDGTSRSISDKAFIVRDDEGTPRRMVGAMSDITDLRLLDAQLHQAQKLETVGQLTGGIAHDFNNLLTIILGNCDIMLAETDDESTWRPLIQSIEDAAERGARVSSDLLAFSRRQPLELKATDINELIRRSSSLFSSAVEANIDLCYDLTASSLVALVDTGKLQSALLNLVLNAKAAISGKGRITIRTRATVYDDDPAITCDPGDYVEVDVIDDGAGMPPEVAERAFEPFFTTKEVGLGTGLGLSSVYGLVKQSGGHAHLVSELDMGTTVTLCFPATARIEAKPPRGVPEELEDGGGQRILVVEDDTDVRAFVAKVLTGIGYLIVEADSGARALELLETDGTFDLLFTDIVMPGGVNGVELAREARQLHPDLRILFTSGYAPEALLKDGDMPSDIPVIHKPFRRAELAARVHECLAAGAVYPG